MIRKATLANLSWSNDAQRRVNHAVAAPGERFLSFFCFDVRAARRACRNVLVLGGSIELITEAIGRDMEEAPILPPAAPVAAGGPAPPVASDSSEPNLSLPKRRPDFAG